MFQLDFLAVCAVLVVWLPVSFVLPTLAPDYGYAKRSGSLDDDHDDDDDDDDDHDDDDDDDDDDDNDVDDVSDVSDAEYAALLSRLDGYLTLLRVPPSDAAGSQDCRPRFVCHAARHGAETRPLSQLFASVVERVVAAAAARRRRDAASAPPRLLRLVRAHLKGAGAGDSCHHVYRRCRLPFGRMVRRDVLRAWQDLARRFAIQLEDQ